MLVLPHGEGIEKVDLDHIRKVVATILDTHYALKTFHSKISIVYMAQKHIKL